MGGGEFAPYPTLVKGVRPKVPKILKHIYFGAEKVAILGAQKWFLADFPSPVDRLTKKVKVADLCSWVPK